MASQRFAMNFTKEQFNALMSFLKTIEDEDIIYKFKNWGTLVDGKDGEKYISASFFGEELRTLCWYLVDVLPLLDIQIENHFEDFSLVIQKREEAYQKQKEEKFQALYEGVKKELLCNPNVTGIEISKNLGVSKDRVYAIWNTVREDIQNGE